MEIFDGVACAALGDVFILLWRDPCTKARLDWAIKMRDKIGPKGDFLFVDVILSSSSPPDAEVRKLLQDDFAGLGARMRRLLVVPVGNPVWQSIVKTIGRGLMLVSKLGARATFCAGEKDLAIACREFASATTPSAEEVLSTLNALRQRLNDSPTPPGRQNTNVEARVD